MSTCLGLGMRPVAAPDVDAVAPHQHRLSIRVGVDGPSKCIGEVALVLSVLVSSKMRDWTGVEQFVSMEFEPQ